MTDEQKTPVYLSPRAGMRVHTRYKGLKGMNKAELMERINVLEFYCQQLSEQCIKDHEDARAWRKLNETKVAES